MGRRNEPYWVVIQFKQGRGARFTRQINYVKVYGSMRKLLHEEKVKIKGADATTQLLREHLKQNGGVFSNGQHRIEACRVIRDKPMIKPVAQIDRETGETIEVFPSTLQASRKTKVNQGNITSACNGNYNHAGGFRWEYV